MSNFRSPRLALVKQLWIAAAICFSGPLWGAETTDRGASPFLFYDGLSAITQPLPTLIYPGASALRMRVWSGGSGPEASVTTFSVIIDVDSDGGMFSFERLVSDVDENNNPYQKRSGNNRQLKDAELSYFRAAFEKLRICSAAKNGKDGMDGWGVYVDFANETRHCFAERWAPDWDNYAPEYNEMSKLLYSLANDGANTSGNGDR